MELEFQGPDEVIKEAKARVAALSLEDTSCEPVKVDLSDGHGERWMFVQPELHACAHDRELLDAHQVHVEACHLTEEQLFEELGQCPVCEENTETWEPEWGDYYPEPIVNLGWPVEFDDHGWGLSARQAANLLAQRGRYFCIVEDQQTGSHFLVGQGCGMNFAWEIAHDFVLLGRCPPTYVDLPRHADANATPRSVTTILALQRSHATQVERSLESIQDLARLARELPVPA